MKLSFLKIRTNSYLRNNKAIRTNLPYKQSISVGIVFSVESKAKHDEVKEFVKRLEHDGKNVEVICYLPKNKDNYEFLFNYFTEKDLSFWGNITSPSVNNFINLPFDFLFYLDTEPNPFVLNIIARSKAKCRIGKLWPNAEPYFEMMIESKDGSLKSLMDSMYKYTHVLR
jgi:hypothetical protein